MMKIQQVQKKNLGFTKICLRDDTLAIGSRLGNVYLYETPVKSEEKKKFEPYAEV